MAISAVVAAISTGTAYATALAAGTAFTFLGLSGIAAVAASFAVGTAMGAALNALTPKPNMSSMSNKGFAINGQSGAALDHQIIYGETRVGGARVYDTTTGTDNKYLHRVLAFSGHEIDSYQTIYVGEDAVTLDGAGMVTAPARYAGLVRIKSYLGTATQTADADLVSETAALVDGKWTSAHRLQGLAYLYVRFEYNADAYPNGLPAVSAVVRGKKLYDPRKDSTSPAYDSSLGVSTHRQTNPATWQFSSNSALCIRDYFASDYGLNQSGSRISDTHVAAAANVCAQTVSSEARYSTNGAFLTSEEPASLLRDLVTAMAGMVWYSGGLWCMKPGASATATLSFNEDDVRGGIQTATRHSRRENFNAVRGTFAGASTEWEVTDYPLVRDTTLATEMVVGLSYTITSLGSTNFTLYGAASNTVGTTFVATAVGVGTGTVDTFLGADNGRPNVMDVPLRFTTSPTACQRIGQVALRRVREQLTIAVNFDLRGLLITVGDEILFSNARFGWTNKRFEVVAWSLGISEDMSLYTKVTLREISTAVFGAETASNFELNNTTLPSPFLSNAPASLTLTPRVQFAADGSYVSSIAASWPASVDQFVRSYEIQWKLSSDTNYFSAVVDGTSYVIGSVLNQSVYDVRVRSINIYGFRGPFVAASVTVGKDTTPPALPTGISATGAFGYITLRWTNPADADFSYIQVWENSSNNSGTATQISSSFGSNFVRSNLDPSVTKYYWLKSVDTSGNVSAFTAVVSATTAFIDNDDFSNGIYSLFTAQGLYAIKDVTSIPGSGGFVGEKIYNRTDGKLYQWTGTAWTLVVANVADGSITETKIANDAITTPKIAANAVTAAEIAAATITGDRIVANTITGGLLATSGIITSSAQIGDALITNAKIGNAAVTAAKIQDAAITNAKIGNLEVDSAKIADLTVGTQKISYNAATVAVSGSAAGGLIGSASTITYITLYMSGIAGQPIIIGSYGMYKGSRSSSGNDYYVSVYMYLNGVAILGSSSNLDYTPITLLATGTGVDGTNVIALVVVTSFNNQVASNMTLFGLQSKR